MTVHGPNHVVLGVDETGAIHHWARADQFIYVVDSGGLEGRYALHGRRVNEWVLFVAERRGWRNCNYGKSGGAAIADAISFGGAD